MFQEAAPFNVRDLVPYVMEEQVAKDVAVDAIQARLSKAILDNYNKFIDGMKFVQDVDMDISRAEITVGNILRKLRTVRAGFVTDALKTLRRRRRRDRLLDVRAKVAMLKARLTGYCAPLLRWAPLLDFRPCLWGAGVAFLCMTV